MSEAAEKMRRHREEFAEAMARGVTIVELRALKARERHEAAVRGEARWAERRRSAPTISDERWMMRD